MNISVTKVELAKNLLNSNSEALLQQIKAILSSYNTDLWDELTDAQKQSVKKAQKQIEKGEFKSHNEVMKKHKKWLSK
jgi:predicted transcriptional regulator